MRGSGLDLDQPRTGGTKTGVHGLGTEVIDMVSSAARVPSQTSDEINRRIRRETEDRLAYFADHPHEISARLDELDHEWDVERAIEANASSLAFTGIVLGATIDKRWLALPAMVTAFLFQHAIQGWCPPIPVLRRMGFRTADEINKERYALKALRGDFQQVQGAPDRGAAALRAVGLRNPSGGDGAYH
jgi:hypothetical protein